LIITWRPRRLPLVEIRAQADVAIGQREDRLGLGEHVEMELALGHAPRLDREHVGRDHEERSRNSAKSSTRGSFS